MPAEFLSISGQQLRTSPQNLRAHVVILGAGASLAAFPNGDANGLLLPLMKDFVATLGLGPLLTAYGVHDHSENFESLYARLFTNTAMDPLRTELEKRVFQYFSELRLPDTLTLYDRMLLSLRGKDAILTFNWDPFLHDAWVRNQNFDPPPIYFLHGNVRVRHCEHHPDRWGAIRACPVCNKSTVSSPLLYPVEDKDYSSNPFIRMHWDAALTLMRSAFTVTVFGYSAPKSDQAAVDLLHTAYMDFSDRKVEHFEVIVRAQSTAVEETWEQFVPTRHLQVRRTYEESWIARYPRRSCEGIYWPMVHGRPVENSPMPITGSLEEIQKWIEPIYLHERSLT